MKNILSHPLLLLIAGAILSSLVIPYYTRQWQNHQKELDFKTSIIDEINKVISNPLVMTDFLYNADFGRNQSIIDKYINSYADLRLSESTISSKLESYFSDAQISHDWNNLTKEELEFFFVTGGNGRSPINSEQYNSNMCNKMSHILEFHNTFYRNNPLNLDNSELKTYHCNGFEGAQQIKNYFPINNESINWYALLHNDNPLLIPIFAKNLKTLEKNIEDKKNDLIKSILKTPTVIF